MVLELQRAERMRDAFDRVRNRVRVVVGRIDAPGIAGPMVRRVADPVERRIAHVDVRRRHVDAGAQDVRAVGELAGAHPPKQVEALVGRTVAIRTVAPRLRQRSPILPDLVGRQAVDVGLAVGDELLRVGVHLLEVIGRVDTSDRLQSKPSQRTSSWIDSTYSTSSLVGIGVVEAQVADAAEFRGDAEIEHDRLGVADVQIAVGLGRKTGVDAAAVAAGLQVFDDDFTDEILCAPGLGRGWLRTAHSLRRS